MVGRSRWRGDYRPAFQLDVETGAWVGSGQATEWWEGSTYSADGSRAVWTRATGPTWGAPVEVMITGPDHPRRAAGGDVADSESGRGVVDGDRAGWTAPGVGR